jgi:hypothetical protein
VTSAGTAYGKDSIFKTLVGIEEGSSPREINIYMNGNHLVIQCDRDLVGASVLVYDMYGKEVFTGKMQGKELKLELNNSPGGYYLVRLVSGNESWNSKIFVK